MKNVETSKSDFFENISKYITNPDDIALIEKAYNYALIAHKDQKRKSGDPYFVHVLAVGNELAKLHAGPQTIAAGLLHDVIEDCDVTRDAFIKEFGEEIFSIVEAVSKISKLKFTDEKEYQAANHRKIFIAMAEDVRVILVKLVDRLNNMRTLQYLEPDKQKRIAKETLEVYAPIAHRLGISEIKNELEDLSFFYLDNERYHEIAKLVEAKKSERDEAIKVMMEDISNVLNSHNIEFRIFGRSKHLFSINKKMVTKNKRFDEILDLLAIRIITKTELNCYEILGYIHATYRPIPGRLKDYIAMPKMNLYQSLHTTIVGKDGRIYEVQIRTEEMDSIAEKGIAAHWAYKENKTKGFNAKAEQKEIVSELAWLKAFKEHSNIDDADYMSHITNDIFNANVYVMTPKGRVIDLPSGSCPIDFAYRIHTEVGDQTVGAVVNGVLVPLNTQLKTGDVIELKLNKNSSPSEDWLYFVKSNYAKNKIKNYLQRKEDERRKEDIKYGESLLKDELNKHNLDVDEYFDQRKLERIFPLFEVNNYNEFMYAIACKSLNPSAVIEKMSSPSKKEIKAEDLQVYTERNKHKSETAYPKSGVVVKGIDSLQIKLSPCCSPCKGDDIVGYITKGNGVKVHRKDCPNISSKNARLIDVAWDENVVESRKYETSIRIYSKDRSYLLTDLVTVIAQFKGNLTSVNITANREELTATASISLMVDDLAHLENIMSNLRKVESVLLVERDIK